MVKTRRIDESFPQGLNQLSHPAKIAVITLFLTGQQGMQRMVKVVAPLGIEAEPAQLAGPDYPGIVQVAFRKQQKFFPGIS